MKKNLFKVLAFAFAATTLSANANEVLSIGASPVPHAEILEQVKPVLAKEGATVTIPNDPTNGGRALLLLQSAGLITLEDPKSLTSTELDIKDNPKKLVIKGIEAAQLPRSLDDVDISVINSNYAISAKFNPLKDSLYIENSDSPYVNLIVGNSKSAKKDSVQKLVKALQSPEVKKFIEEKYKGAVVAAF